MSIPHSDIVCDWNRVTCGDFCLMSFSGYDIPRCGEVTGVVTARSPRFDRCPMRDHSRQDQVLIPVRVCRHPRPRWPNRTDSVDMDGNRPTSGRMASSTYSAFGADLAARRPANPITLCDDRGIDFVTVAGHIPMAVRSRADPGPVRRLVRAGRACSGQVCRSSIGRSAVAKCSGWPR